MAGSSNLLMVPMMDAQWPALNGLAIELTEMIADHLVDVIPHSTERWSEISEGSFSDIKSFRQVCRATRDGAWKAFARKIESTKFFTTADSTQALFQLTSLSELRRKIRAISIFPLALQKARGVPHVDASTTEMIARVRFLNRCLQAYNQQMAFLDTLTYRNMMAQVFMNLPNLSQLRFCTYLNADGHGKHLEGWFGPLNQTIEANYGKWLYMNSVRFSGVYYDHIGINNPDRSPCARFIHQLLNAVSVSGAKITNFQVSARTGSEQDTFFWDTFSRVGSFDSVPRSTLANAFMHLTHYAHTLSRNPVQAVHGRRPIDGNLTTIIGQMPRLKTLEIYIPKYERHWSRMLHKLGIKKGGRFHIPRVRKLTVAFGQPAEMGCWPSQILRIICMFRLFLKELVINNCTMYQEGSDSAWEEVFLQLQSDFHLRELCLNNPYVRYVGVGHICHMRETTPADTVLWEAAKQVWVNSEGVVEEGTDGVQMVWEEEE